MSLLYERLTRWYRLLDPPEDHADETRAIQEALESASVGPLDTLLELGSGAGHNALHLKKRFRCTLSDVSEPMLGLSRDLNPECRHLHGDMRTLRLNETFDTVLVHDAITYMVTKEDLQAAMRTAFLHTRPGGAAVFAPDCFCETFADAAQLHEGDDGTLSLRCLEWTWDPDPADHTYTVDYAFLLRDGGEMLCEHDRHLEGLFSTQAWVDLLRSVGYDVEPIARPIGDGSFDRVFLCRRPLTLRSSIRP